MLWIFLKLIRYSTKRKIYKRVDNIYNEESANEC